MTATTVDIKLSKLETRRTIAQVWTEAHNANLKFDSLRAQGENVATTRAQHTTERANTIEHTHTPTAAILAALDNALIAIRQTHPDVPGALAIVIATGKGKVHGHFQPGSWADIAGEHEGSARHEILISSESLARGAEATLTTLIHETAHALAYATLGPGKDTTRQGRYHNKNFRDNALAMGLVVEANKQIGFVTTGLTDATKIHYSGVLEQLARVLVTHRKLETKPKAPKTTVKVGCECETETGKQLTVMVPIKFWDQSNLYCENCETHLVTV